MDREKIENEIDILFSRYASCVLKINPWDKNIKNGKMYELYVLSFVIDDLVKRGFKIKFTGSNLKFKSAPGKIKSTDPHFIVESPDGKKFYIFLNIEFEVIENSQFKVNDLSKLHEIDIILVDKNNGYPSVENILLAVECKSTSNFNKEILKETLGVHRELCKSFLEDYSRLSEESQNKTIKVKTWPKVEFWLAHIDKNGGRYTKGPAKYSIQLHHIEP